MDSRVIRRSRALVAVCVAVLVALLLPAAGCSGAVSQTESASPKAVTKVSATLLDLSPEELFEQAPVVIRARVDGPVGPLSVDAPSGDDRVPGSTQEWMYTQWSVVPTQVYKTDGTISSGKPVIVALRGGQSDEQVIEWEAEADLASGEEVVLYLGKTDGPGTEAPGRYFTHQLMVGKYKIDKKTGMAVSKDSRRNLRLNDLEAKLK